MTTNTHVRAGEGSSIDPNGGGAMDPNGGGQS
jgi:hypothetical protein